MHISLKNFRWTSIHEYTPYKHTDTLAIYAAIDFQLFLDHCIHEIECLIIGIACLAAVSFLFRICRF